MTLKKKCNIFYEIKTIKKWFSKNMPAKRAIKAAHKWIKDPSEENLTIAGKAADSAYDFARSCAWQRRCATEAAALSARCAVSSSGKAAFHFAIYAVQNALEAAAWTGGPSGRRKAIRRIEKMLQKRYLRVRPASETPQSGKATLG